MAKLSNYLGNRILGACGRIGGYGNVKLIYLESVKFCQVMCKVIMHRVQRHLSSRLVYQGFSGMWQLIIIPWFKEVLSSRSEFYIIINNILFSRTKISVKMKGKFREENMDNLAKYKQKISEIMENYKHRELSEEEATFEIAKIVLEAEYAGFQDGMREWWTPDPIEIKFTNGHKYLYRMEKSWK